MDVGPVCHVELLIDSKAPLIVKLAESALVFLCFQVVSVQGMALSPFTQVLHLLDKVLVHLSADNIVAEAASTSSQ